MSGNGKRFRAAEAGAHWGALQALAECYERAGLTNAQAEAARMGSQGYRYGQIAEALNVGYRDARHLVRNAVKRLWKLRQWQIVGRWGWYADLLRCLRNNEIADWEIGEAMCPPLRGGEPVGMVRARPAGCCVEDLMGPTDTTAPQSPGEAISRMGYGYVDRHEELKFLRDHRLFLQYAVQPV